AAHLGEGDPLAQHLGVARLRPLEVLVQALDLVGAGRRLAFGHQEDGLHADARAGEGGSGRGEQERGDEARHGGLRGSISRTWRLRRPSHRAILGAAVKELSLAAPRGVRLAATLWSAGAAGVVLAHGYTSDRSSRGRFPALAEELARRGLSAMSFDF